MLELKCVRRAGGGIIEQSEIAHMVVCLDVDEVSADIAAAAAAATARALPVGAR